MPEAGARRLLPLCLSWGRHPLRWLLVAFLACVLAAVASLLWRAGQGWQAGRAGAAWWAAAAMAMLVPAVRCWPHAWRTAACRYAGVASPGDALMVWVALPDGQRMPAPVSACWHLGEVATVLRLAPAGSARATVPGMLPVWRMGRHGDATARRALLRALQTTSGAHRVRTHRPSGAA